MTINARKCFGLIIPIVALLAFGNCTSNKSAGNSSDKPKMKGTAIQGGTFEASGVQFVPGTNGVLFVDDSRTDEVLWMQIDSSGQQAGTPKALKTGATVEDPEAITFDGTYFYIIGSQSSRKSGDRTGLVRFKFDPQNQTISDTQTLAGVRPFLVENVPELKDDGDKKGEDGGLNIEGLAWDYEQNRILFGLRSPQVNDDALVVPARFKDPNGPFSIENLQLEPAIRLSLGGAAIRDIQYNNKLKSFLIVAGAPEHHEKTGFSLWQWKPGQANPLMKLELAQKMKPEGITTISMGAGDSYKELLFIVGDASSYLSVDYADAGM